MGDGTAQAARQQGSSARGRLVLPLPTPPHLHLPSRPPAHPTCARRRTPSSTSPGMRNITTSPWWDCMQAGEGGRVRDGSGGMHGTAHHVGLEHTGRRAPRSLCMRTSMHKAHWSQFAVCGRYFQDGCGSDGGEVSSPMPAGAGWSVCPACPKHARPKHARPPSRHPPTHPPTHLHRRPGAVGGQQQRGQPLELPCPVGQLSIHRGAVQLRLLPASVCGVVHGEGGQAGGVTLRGTRAERECQAAGRGGSR